MLGPLRLRTAACLPLLARVRINGGTRGSWGGGESGRENHVRCSKLHETDDLGMKDDSKSARAEYQVAADKLS